MVITFLIIFIRVACGKILSYLNIGIEDSTRSPPVYNDIMQGAVFLLILIVVNEINSLSWNLF